MHQPRRAEDHRLRRFWTRWFPVLAYMALMFTLSSIPNLSPPVDLGNADKIAHFLEYAGLGLLLARAWRGTRWRDRLGVVLLLTLVGGGAVAVLDETYQGHVAGRERSAADLGTDLAGLLVASGIVVGIARRRGGSGQ